MIYLAPFDAFRHLHHSPADHWPSKLISLVTLNTAFVFDAIIHHDSQTILILCSKVSNACLVVLGSFAYGCPVLVTNDIQLASTKGVEFKHQDENIGPSIHIVMTIQISTRNRCVVFPDNAMHRRVFIAFASIKKNFDETTPSEQPISKRRPADSLYSSPRFPAPSQVAFTFHVSVHFERLSYREGAGCAMDSINKYYILASSGASCIQRFMNIP